MSKKTSENVMAAAADQASALSEASATEARTEKKTLAEALASLDPANDDHWTADGKPRMEVLEDLTGGNLTRADVDGASELTRETAREKQAVGEGDVGELGDVLGNNDQVEAAEGLSPETEAAIAEQAQEHDAAPERAKLSHDELEDYVAALAKQFGWPTKEQIAG